MTGSRSLLLRPGFLLAESQATVSVALLTWIGFGIAQTSVVFDRVAAVLMLALASLSLAAPRLGLRPGVLELSAVATTAGLVLIVATRGTAQGETAAVRRSSSCW